MIWLFSLLWLFPFIFTFWLFCRDEERHCDFRVRSFDSRKESKCNSYKKITVWIFNNKKRNKIRQRRISLMQIKILSSSEHNTTQLYKQTACNEFKETRYFKSYCNFWKSEKTCYKNWKISYWDCYVYGLWVCTIDYFLFQYFPQYSSMTQSYRNRSLQPQYIFEAITTQRIKELKTYAANTEFLPRYEHLPCRKRIWSHLDFKQLKLADKNYQIES